MDTSIALLLLGAGALLYFILYKKNKFLGSLFFMFLGGIIAYYSTSDIERAIFGIVFVISIISVLYEFGNWVGKILKNR